MINDTPAEEKDIFANVETVAVIGGVVDCSGNLQADIQICRVVEAGENDLLVSDQSAYTERVVIVPKALCIPVHTSYDELIAAKKTIPELGDLVLFYGKKDWKATEPIKIAGILCEIKYKLGNPITASVLSGGEMKDVDYTALLVLQRNP